MTRTKHSFEDKRVTKYNLVTRTAVLCVVCCFFLPVLAAYAEEVDKAVPFEVSVDPRVELMSILFRLAGNPEYNASEVRSYTRLVDRQFGPWRDHRAVRLAAQLAQRGAGFDAPMHLAIYLGDAAGLEPRIPIDAWTGEMAERWPRDETAKFLEAARDFVQQSDFAGFIARCQPLYGQMAVTARTLLRREAHLEWFDTFFGARPGADFRIVLAPLNGGCSYGPMIEVGGREELYCILGVWKCTDFSKPIFQADMMDVVAHEFCHSYVNPILIAHFDELEAPFLRLYPQVADRMAGSPYGHWTSVTIESVVRAAVVRYLDATRGKEAAAKQTASEVEQGFIWTTGLAALLEQYETQRTQYPTWESFFPQVIAFFHETAAK